MAGGAGLALPRNGPPTVNPEQWVRLERLFAEAAERPEAERESFLRGACRDDAALRGEVESLLEAHRQADGFLDRPAVGGWRETPVDLGEVGKRFGPYRVVARVGQGGMSTVYLAVRADDEYRKRVAIKLLRPEQVGDESVQRLRVERQILASLDHPNIARFYDGGSTAEGLPYFVMEYIEGEAIDLYCDRRKLSIGQRLDLFRRVCLAVHYAHQNLVIHRDLKPANILVGGDGVPKLVDFGIAKLLNPELVGQSLEPTVIWPRHLTPAYASPEQIEGRAVTTAADIYALGVILCQLLSGRLPFDRGGLSAGQVLRCLASEQLVKPSELAVQDRDVDRGQSRELTPAEVAERRALRPEGLRRRLAGDLNNIVAKALCYEPQRRYRSAERLAADLENHVAGLPVSARPATIGYRVGKFIRRHALASAFALLVVAALAGLSTFLARQAASLEREREISQLSRDFLESLFESADPSPDAGEPLTARQLFDRGRRRVDVLDPAPEVKAPMLSTLGRSYTKLGEYPEAESVLKEADQLYRAGAATSVADLAQSCEDLGEVLFYRGNLEEAEALNREALASWRTVSPRRDTSVFQALINLATVLQYQGRGDEANRYYQEGFGLGFDRSEVPAQEKATGLTNFSTLLYQRGDLDAAEEALRRAQAFWRQSDPTAHFAGRTVTQQSLAALLAQKGNLEEGIAILEEVAQEQRKVLGPEHPYLALTLTNLGSLQYRAGHLEAAKQPYREGLRIRRSALGEEHPDVATSLHHLAVLHQASGEDREAEILLRQAVDIFNHQTDTSLHPEALPAHRNLAQLLLARGDRAAVIADLEPFLKRLDQDDGIGAETLAALHRLLAQARGEAKIAPEPTER